MKANLTSVALLLTGLGLALAEAAAHAATYNFYFNNTEQGDNSTATPNVTVMDDGKVLKDGKPVDEKAPPAPGETPAAPAPVPAPAPVAAATSRTDVPGAIAPQDDFRHFRIAGGVSYFHAYAYGGPDGMSNANPGAGTLQPSISGTLFFSRSFAATVSAARLPQDGSGDNWMLGAEFEILPFHITVGRYENLIELGALVGFQMMQQYATVAEASSTPYWDPSTSYYMGNPAPASAGWAFYGEAGLRANLNLGSRWSVISAVRFTQDYAGVEAGLALKI